MFGRGSRPEVRGHDPEISLAALAAAEPRMLDGTRAAASARDYHILGKWCIAAPFLRRLLKGPDRPAAWRAFGAISNVSVIGLAALLPRQKVVQATSEASALVLRNNIRAIYPERGVTAKLANPARPDARAAIRNEAELRRCLKETAHIGVPAMRRAGGADEAFIVEEFVVGAERRKSVPAEWARALFGFYAANGIEPRPIEEIVDQETAYRTFLDGCQLLDVNVSEALIRAARPRDGLFGQGRLLVGLCHGDLAPSNLLFTDGRTLVVDWEYGGRDLLLSDAARLASGDDGFCRMLLGEVEAWSQRAGGAILSPEKQLLAGCILAVNRRIERYQGFLATASSASLIRKYRAKVQAIVNLAERLQSSA